MPMISALKRGPGLQGHPQQHRNFEVSLDYMISCLKKKEKYNQDILFLQNEYK